MSDVNSANEAARRLLKDVNPTARPPISSMLAADIRTVAEAVLKDAPMAVTDAAADAVALAIIEHDEDQLTCYDHPESACCPCGCHGMGKSEWQRHRALAVLRVAVSAR